MEKLISEFSFGLFFWQLLIFIFLVLLLKKFAWKPILDTVNERESSIKDAMSEADKARNEMLAIQESNQKVLKEARAEREALLKDARNTGAEIVAQAKTDAKTEANKIISQAQEAIQNEILSTGKDKTSFLIQTVNNPGALINILRPFEKKKINLSKIETRPSRGNIDSHDFFVDCEGHQFDNKLKLAIKEVRSTGSLVRVLGSYPQHI